MVSGSHRDAVSVMMCGEYSLRGSSCWARAVRMTCLHLSRVRVQANMTQLTGQAPHLPTEGDHHLSATQLVWHVLTNTNDSDAHSQSHIIICIHMWQLAGCIKVSHIPLTSGCPHVCHKSINNNYLRGTQHLWYRPIRHWTVWGVTCENTEAVNYSWCLGTFI